MKSRLRGHGGPIFLSIAGLGLAALLHGASPSALAAAPAPAGKPLGSDCTPGPFAKDTYFPTPAFPEQTRAPAIKGGVPLRVEVVLSGLPNPRSLAFLDGGRVLVSVWPGELRTIGADGKLSAAIAGVPKAMGGRDGAFDIALAPDFASNRTLYLVYRILKPGQKVEPGKRPEGIGQVARARLSAGGDRLEDLKVIYQGAYLRRITVGHDGTLIFTSLSADGSVSQKIEDPDGKVLRINADGSIPEDNPFAARQGAKPEIYDLGHRDIDGVAIDGQGGIWTVEHGPRGGDELNRIEAGKDYGYPTIGYGRDYSGSPINNDKTAQPGMEQPVYFWEPDIGPAGLMVYSGRMFPAWKGDIFTGALATRRLIRLQMKDGKVTGEEHLLADRCQRIRDVREAPDGSIWVVTNDQKSEMPGEVLRITSAR